MGIYIYIILYDFILTYFYGSNGRPFNDINIIYIMKYPIVVWVLNMSLYKKRGPRKNDAKGLSLAALSSGTV